MSNPFASRLASIGAPLGIRHNGESITLTFDDDSTAVVTAIVDIKEQQQVNDGESQVEGNISIRTADVADIITPQGVPLRATVREQIWHVYGRGPDQFGMTTFLIRRVFAEADHTNMYDISDTQAVWHQA